MIKEINGRTYMTGTSAGSLYPVVMLHPNGIHVGLRLMIGKTEQPGIFGVKFYGRVEKVVLGEPVPATTAELFEALPNLVVRFAGPTHVSGTFGNGMFDSNKSASKAAAFGEMFEQVVTGIVTSAKKAGSKLEAIPATELKDIGQERYLTEIEGQVDEATVEQQIENGASSFDFSTFFSKPGPEEPKK